jgi:NAD(P)-dependent dehydrogenase (short-subunit alcohol dehydrogenase family)
LTLLAGKEAVVTGGSRGLGAAVVARFASEGAEGTILDHVAAGDLPPGWTSLVVDVGDDDGVAAAFAGLPTVDVVVTAAGIVPSWAGVAEADLDTWDDVMRVNARGTLSTIKHAAGRLRDGGAIVAIGSLNSWRGDPNIVSYVASKHAVLGIVRSAALELGRRGIRVNAVGPGPVATDALLERMRTRERELGVPVADALAAAARQTALGRIASIDEVAGAVLFLACDLSSGITGHLLPVDGGIA